MPAIKHTEGEGFVFVSAGKFIGIFLRIWAENLQGFILLRGSIIMAITNRQIAFGLFGHNRPTTSEIIGGPLSTVKI
jgi:hypothetical protein